ncbi:hypothetical protein FOE67_26450, partial [Streptomyces calidiresistens]|nr:hypothetical protein [Streptomyces calidiresistens]
SEFAPCVAAHVHDPVSGLHAAGFACRWDPAEAARKAVLEAVHDPLAVARTTEGRAEIGPLPGPHGTTAQAEAGCGDRGQVGGEPGAQVTAADPGGVGVPGASDGEQDRAHLRHPALSGRAGGRPRPGVPPGTTQERAPGPRGVGGEQSLLVDHPPDGVGLPAVGRIGKGRVEVPWGAGEHAEQGRRDLRVGPTGERRRGAARPGPADRRSPGGDAAVVVGRGHHCGGQGIGPGPGEVPAQPDAGPDRGRVEGARGVTGVQQEEGRGPVSVVGRGAAGGRRQFHQDAGGRPRIRFRRGGERVQTVGQGVV